MDAIHLDADMFDFIANFRCKISFGYCLRIVVSYITTNSDASFGEGSVPHTIVQSQLLLQKNGFGAGFKTAYLASLGVCLSPGMEWQTSPMYFTVLSLFCSYCTA